MRTLIKNGEIVDGSGRPSVPGHLLLEGDRIEAVLRRGADLPGADRVVDAAGLCVAPGFIDMHSHADWILPREDHGDLLGHMLEQGITTVVGGNCGFSPAPVQPHSVPLIERLAGMLIDRPLGYGWRSFGEFLEQLETAHPAVNVAMLVGHASLRYLVMGRGLGQMNRAELDQTSAALTTALDEGACGLSLGLGYRPGMYSPQGELEAVCRATSRADKPVTVHCKALSVLSPCYPAYTPEAHNVRALREILLLAQRTETRLQISHFIFVGRRSWPTADRCLAMVDRVWQQGLDVMIDAFPYTCGNTTINAVLPYWYLARLPGSHQSRVARLRVASELGLGLPIIGFSYDDFQVMDAGVPGWEALNGRRVAEIAREWGLSGLDAVLRISRESNGAALMLFHAYSGEPGDERVLEAVLRHPLCLFETDTIMKRQGHANPATLGAFPRILGEICRQRGLLGLEDAVRRMTSASADRFGLRGRGRLRSNHAADVVLFDPAEIIDTPAVGSTPPGRPKGIRQVYVNGTLVVENGRAREALRAGQVLRP